MEDLIFLKYYCIKNKVFLMKLLFEYTDPHVRAIRDVLNIYADNLIGDEDGYAEIQNSLNQCEWGFLGEFSNKIFYLSSIVSSHIFVYF
jgi:hypothetical protein